MSYVNPALLLKGAGILYTAPAGTPPPTSTPAAGLFPTTPWDPPWAPVGSTAQGSQFSDAITTTDLYYAEWLLPVTQIITDRAASWTVALAEINRTNLMLALGTTAASTTITGAGTTTLTVLAPSDVTDEDRRIMLGWQSEDDTTRFIARQCTQTGDLTMGLRKGANLATLNVTWQLEKPFTNPPTAPYSIYFSQTRSEAGSPPPAAATGRYGAGAYGTATYG